MKLSNKQADALKTWCKDAVIQYADVKAGSQVGPISTANALVKRGLIVRESGVDAGYKLTSLGVAELRLRGFFTRPLGVDVVQGLS